jgi:Arc/MetJ family transcription regulator
MSRTNIEIDDELIADVMSQYHLPSKRAAVDFALRRVRVERITKDEALAMQGSGGWEGDLDAMRSGSQPASV